MSEFGLFGVGEGVAGVSAGVPSDGVVSPGKAGGVVVVAAGVVGVVVAAGVAVTTAAASTAVTDDDCEAVVEDGVVEHWFVTLTVDAPVVLPKLKLTCFDPL